MPSHRETTRRSTARWQIAAVALAGTTAVVLALPMDRLLTPSPAENTNPDETAPIAQAPEVERQPTDVSSAAESLRTLSGDRVAVAEPPPTPANDDTITTTPPIHTGPTNEISAWKYLGSIVGPRSTNALVKVNERQHIIAQGGELGAVQIVSVGTDHIVVREGDTEHRLEVQKAQGLIAPSAPPSAAAGMTRPGMTPNSALDARRAAMTRNLPQGTPGMMNPPHPQGGGELTDQQMQLLRKTLGNPAVPERERMRVLEESGFPPTMAPVERARRLRSMNLPLSSDPFVQRAMDAHGINREADNAEILHRLEEVFGSDPYDGGL